LTIPEGAAPRRHALLSSKHAVRDDVGSRTAKLTRATKCCGSRSAAQRALFAMLGQQFAVPRLALEDVLSGCGAPSSFPAATRFVVARRQAGRAPRVRADRGFLRGRVLFDATATSRWAC
jgi:hypothetical protein